MFVDIINLVHSTAEVEVLEACTALISHGCPKDDRDRSRSVGVMTKHAQKI
jgi:hypothetical protein